MPDNEYSNWNEARMHVHAELERLDENGSEIRVELNRFKLDHANDIAAARADMSRELSQVREKQVSFNNRTTAAIAALNVKAGIWGAVAGAVVALGAILMAFLKH